MAVKQQKVGARNLTDRELQRNFEVQQIVSVKEWLFVTVTEWGQ